MMTTAKQSIAADPSAPDHEALLGELAEALRRVRRGDLQVRLPRRAGLAGEVADAFNDVVSLQERQHLDLRRISRIVGRDGRLTERLDDEGLDGSWAEGQRAVNSLIDDLGRPDHGDRPGDRGGGRRRPVPAHGAGDRRSSAAR